MTDTDQEGWLSVDEAARYLGVTRRAVHKYIQRGKLPAYKTGVGNRTLLKREEVEGFKMPYPAVRKGTQR